MKKIIILLLSIISIFVLIAGRTFSQLNSDKLETVKIESAVYDELNKNKEARVVIILKDETETLTKELTNELSKLKEKIKEKQEKVLEVLSKQEFKLEHRYKTINALAGFITKNELNKLKNNPDVKRVYLDRKAHTLLSESLPLINADNFHNLGFNGTGQTVCIPDTGVDYKHVNIGNSACSISGNINGTIQSYSLESTHPYSDNFDYTWTITKPGFSNIAVHFSSIQLEPNYDFLYIKNPAGNFVQVFTGTYNDIWSVSIPGDTILIHLKTDFSVTDWGFAIDKVLNGTTNSVWSNCGSIINGYDFENNDNNPLDDEGHGTHVAGIVASQNSTYKGIAPGAKIAAVKVLDETGSGWFSTVAAGVDWCIDNKDIYGISVISMSLGEGGEYDASEVATECDAYATGIAINTARNNGIFVAVASGNEAHTNGISYPACASGATSVGASYDADVGSKNWPRICRDGTTSADKIVCFTNRDEILDLLAPGCVTTSLKLNGGTVGYCGTSMAAPHVAAVATLLKESNSTMTPQQIESTLKNDGISIYDSKTGLTFKRIDLQQAASRLDIDNDLIPNAQDNCPFIANPGQEDADNDGKGNVCDNCQDTWNPFQENYDLDSLGNACDNCPFISNPDQNDTDNDRIGDVCDVCPLDALNDIDNDEICGNIDNCPYVDNPLQEDFDFDSYGDICDLCANDFQNDIDNDLICVGQDYKFPKIAGNDNCPLVSNPNQENFDFDSYGDICDEDDDNDLVNDSLDNCDFVVNPLQENYDNDDYGDVCDPCTDYKSGILNFTSQNYIGTLNSTGGYYEQYDDCVGLYTLKEYYCQNNQVKTKDILCFKLGLNYKCTDGACKIPSVIPPPTPEPFEV